MIDDQSFIIFLDETINFIEWDIYLTDAVKEILALPEEIISADIEEIEEFEILK